VSSTNTQGMISISHLEKTYETPTSSVHAISDVSFDVKEGEFVSVLGPSGCGKSTLMMMAAGLRKKSSGEIKVNGKDVNGPMDDIGVVFQRDVLLDWANVLDNVMFQIQARKLPVKDYLPNAKKLLDSVGLADFHKAQPYELSGGMRQRVSICRALVHNPQLLLMDEPFGALDALTREQMMLDLQSIWLESKKTVLFITHSIQEAVFLSDRVIVMSPRPGTIDLDLRIDLPRPRSLQITETPEFNAYMRKIREAFEARGVITNV